VLYVKVRLQNGLAGTMKVPFSMHDDSTEVEIRSTYRKKGACIRYCGYIQLVGDKTVYLK
jgi:hypothetical protein